MLKRKLRQKKLSVRRSRIAGYGVFAEENIKKNNIIEECHVILTRSSRLFENIAFEINRKTDALVLGFGSIYNHSDTPSACFHYDTKKKLMVFKALKFIAAGEEIFVSYGKDWFKHRSMEMKKTSSR